MKKKILVTLGVLAVSVSAYAAVAGVRCIFCDGTGFANHGKSPFTCTACGGKGWK